MGIGRAYMRVIMSERDQELSGLAERGLQWEVGQRPLPGGVRVTGVQKWQQGPMLCGAEFLWTEAGKLMILAQLSSINLRRALNGVGAVHPERGTGLGTERATPGQNR